MEEPRSYKQTARKFARARREAMTKSEEKLWWELRAHRLGFPFRRQMPIGPYTVDFACIRLGLVIEIDGRTHEKQEAMDRDAARQDWLEREGWHVLRFADDKVIGGLPIVVAQIEKTCAELQAEGMRRSPTSGPHLVRRD
jgi:very-short-patch-repair endonuclease